nr:HNH endonuclease signature motif containing protein [Blastococcus saxobsidens]
MDGGVAELADQRELVRDAERDLAGEGGIRDACGDVVAVRDRQPVDGVDVGDELLDRSAGVEAGGAWVGGEIGRGAHAVGVDRRPFSTQKPEVARCAYHDPRRPAAADVGAWPSCHSRRSVRAGVLAAELRSPGRARSNGAGGRFHRWDNEALTSAFRLSAEDGRGKIRTSVRISGDREESAMGLDDGFVPFPDAGTFRLGGSTPAPAPPRAADREATSARGAEATAAGEAARQLSMELPDDVAAVLAGALELAGADLLDGSPATQASVLLARVRGLTQLQNVIEAAVARTVRAAECAQAADFDGHKTIKSWMSGHLNVSPATAARVTRAGRTLEQLPRWSEAACAGRVTPDQTAVVARVATPARLAAAAELGVELHGDDGVDATLLACATGDHPETLPAVVARMLDWIDPDGPEPDPTRRRELHLSPSAGAEGGGTIHGRLDAAGYEKVATALTAYQQAGRAAEDDRSHAQQMADALVQLAYNGLAAADTPMLRKHHAQVAATISAGDLLDPDVIAGAARLGSGQRVSNEVARQLACDSIITRVLFGPDGMPLNIGRSQRLVPAPIRKAADARDGGCTFAGCSAPTWWCDAHHVQEWIADHGETSVANTALLCERHHTKVHHGFSIAWDPVEKRWRTYREDGTEIIVGYPHGEPASLDRRLDLPPENRHARHAIPTSDPSPEGGCGSLGGVAGLTSAEAHGSDQV